MPGAGSLCSFPQHEKRSFYQDIVPGRHLWHECHARPYFHSLSLDDTDIDCEPHVVHTMAALPLESTTIGLAGRAAELASELSAVQAAYGHTSADVESVANEIAMLAATLWRLHEAMADDPSRYTESFNQDLAEITLELKAVFEEISECCVELQKADPTPGNAVSWLFRKSKVHHLQKHLEALKTTLVVMRTVLYHGKECGTQPSVFLL
jgi:hypothetical protein